MQALIVRDLHAILSLADGEGAEKPGFLRATTVMALPASEIALTTLPGNASVS